MSATFVTLADTLVSDFDVVELLDVLAKTCVDLRLCDDAGLVLADPTGKLRVLASSSEQTRLLELLEIQNDEGPCLDCYRLGRAVSAPSAAVAEARWPRFVAAARAAGFESVLALPMRLRDQTIGALSLFLVESQQMDADDRATAQALADVATIGILQQRVAQDKSLLARHLESTLNNRLVIEQAKGVLAEVGGLAMAETFGRLKEYARAHRLPVSATALRLTQGDLSGQVVLGETTEPR